MSRINGNGLAHAPGIPILAGRLNGAAPSLPDREPPHNIEAEQSLLGSILLDPGLMAEVADLVDVPDFYRDAHQVVFRALKDLWEEGTPIDAVTLADKLISWGAFEKIGADETLREIVDIVPIAVNAKYYAKIIRERAITRMAIAAAEEIIREGYSNQYTAQEMVERATKHLNGVESPPDDDADIALPGAWPDDLHEDAFHGVAGELVRRMEPHTEADPAALLLQFLCAFGNAAGHDPHWMIGPARHGLNLYVAIVGRSSRARKGTSWTFVETVMRQIDEEWAKNRVTDGLSTGEGMIEAVKDPKYKREKVGGTKELGGGGYEDVLVDPGEDDKRMLWVEGEFGAVLSMKGRDGNVLDGTVKKLWENGTTATRSKNNPSRCTGAHVSIIGHVTIGELLRKMSDIDVSGGFANRFLWICSRRKKLIPRPRIFRIGEIHDLILHIRDAIEGLRFVDWSAPMSMSEDAWAIYEPLYYELGKDRPGILDDLCSRAEPQTLRLASLYAILDKSTRIEVCHLRAAIAVWKYSEASVRCIFGDRAYDDPDESRVLAAMEAQPAGLTTTDIRRRVFKGHKNALEIGEILGRLLRSGKIAQATIKTTGRDRIVWTPSAIQAPSNNRPDPAPKAH